MRSLPSAGCYTGTYTGRPHGRRYGRWIAAHLATHAENDDPWTRPRARWTRQLVDVIYLRPAPEIQSLMSEIREPISLRLRRVSLEYRDRTSRVLGAASRPPDPRGIALEATRRPEFQKGSFIDGVRRDAAAASHATRYTLHACSRPKRSSVSTGHRGVALTSQASDPLTRLKAKYGWHVHKTTKASKPDETFILPPGRRPVPQFVLDTRSFAAGALSGWC